MKKLVFLMIFMAFIFSMPGCRKGNSSTSHYRAVTAIDIVTQKDDTILRRHYTDQTKMQYVLTFLRLLKPTGKPDTDPEALTEDMFLIALTFSDGSQNFYRQTGHRYVAKDDQDWFSIDPNQALKLYELMAHVPSDETG